MTHHDHDERPRQDDADDVEEPEDEHGDEHETELGPEPTADERTHQDAGLGGGTAGADRDERVGDA